jgi:hypothetical protein
MGIQLVGLLLLLYIKKKKKRNNDHNIRYFAFCLGMPSVVYTLECVSFCMSALHAYSCLPLGAAFAAIVINKESPHADIQDLFASLCFHSLDSALVFPTKYTAHDTWQLDASTESHTW